MSKVSKRPTVGSNSIRTFTVATTKGLSKRTANNLAGFFQIQFSPGHDRDNWTLDGFSSRI